MNFMDHMATRVLHPAWRLAKGDHSDRYVRDVQALNRADEGRIRDHQLARLRAVAAHAAAHTPHYRRVFREAGVDPARMDWDEFRSLPVLTKDDLRERREELISERHSPEALRETATGGTTASPVRMCMDWEALYHRVSATIAFDRWLGYEPGARMAYLWCAMQDMPEGSSLKKRVMDRWVVRKRFYPATEMEEHVMERYWRELRRFRPVLLQAYATPLALFARFLLDRGLSLSIPAVSSCAETLSPDQRALIGEALGAEVYDWYGAREAGRIATECEEHQGMHVNAYGLHVEVVDAGLDHGVGEILVSDLWNVGMPMLRYAIGDLGSLDHSPCACGRALPRLSSIAGRTLDVFVNAHGRKVPGVVFPNRFVKDDNTIREMQIVQEDYSRFRVLLVPGREYGEETRTWLSGRLDEFMHQHNDLRVELVDRIPREASGKVMFCKREFDPEELGPAAGA